ncbi:unnamed protein product, partial [Soboliphyme baturini]|uniref:Multiciliate differentiation and DNA synthesis-associated cell cycle protein n=1 Tax=Soboliphyme baturini TaxID=241478 RepID=A0A183JAX8_9BILA
MTIHRSFLRCNSTIGREAGERVAEGPREQCAFVRAAPPTGHKDGKDNRLNHRNQLRTPSSRTTNQHSAPASTPPKAAEGSSLGNVSLDENCLRLSVRYSSRPVASLPVDLSGSLVQPAIVNGSRPTTDRHDPVMGYLNEWQDVLQFQVNRITALKNQMDFLTRSLDQRQNSLLSELAGLHGQLEKLTREFQTTLDDFKHCLRRGPD